MDMPWMHPTYICWDMNVFPPPPIHVEPFLVGRTIITAAFKQGLHGRAQIRTYCNEGTMDSTILKGYDEDGFIVTTVANEFAKVNTMLMDMMLWAFNGGEPTNFLVITKISKDTEYLMRGLLALKQRGSHVFLALPDMSVPTDLTGIKSFTRTTGQFLEVADYAPGYNLIKVWLCPTLLEEIVKDDVDEEDVDEGPKVEQEDDLEDEMGYESLGVLQPIVFSVGSTSNDTDFEDYPTTNINTSVLWDVEDYPLPPSLTLARFYKNIRQTLMLKGYNGALFIWAYVPASLQGKFEIMAERFNFEKDTRDRFFFVPKVPLDKYSRINMMSLDFLLWAIDNPLRGPNLLVIAKFMRAETFFYTLLRCLHHRGYTVFLTLPGGDDDVVAPIGAPDLQVLPWDNFYFGLTAEKIHQTTLPIKRNKA